MLYQFIVRNFKSFRDEAVLNLAAASYDDHPSHLRKGAAKGSNLLRAGAIYGANASGKTNLVKAIQFAKNLIVEGTTGEMAIQTHPFRLSERTIHAPSQFEFVIEVSGRVYHYGFVLHSEKIEEEWLIDVTKGSEKVVFERISKAGNTEVTPGKAYFKKADDRKLVEFVAKTTRVNQPFLKEAFERNLDPIKPVYRWFSDVLHVIPAVANYRLLELRTKSDESFSNFLGRLLKDAGTGIEKIETEVLDLDFDQYLPSMDQKQRDAIASHIRDEKGVVTIDDGRGNKYLIHIDDPKKGPELLRLRAMHKNEDGDMIPFELKEESEGTRRFLNLLPILYDTMAEDRVYVVDELERRLHPDLAQRFLELFLDQPDSCRSQLLFTTHNTHIMDQEFMRRDEFWFVDKDLETGASTLYPLTDMGVRKDLRLDKAYLHGRFGALPKLNRLVTQS